MGGDSQRPAAAQSAQRFDSHGRRHHPRHQDIHHRSRSGHRRIAVDASGEDQDGGGGPGRNGQQGDSRSSRHQPQTCLYRHLCSGSLCSRNVGAHRGHRHGHQPQGSLGCVAPVHDRSGRGGDRLHPRGLGRRAYPGVAEIFRFGLLLQLRGLRSVRGPDRGAPDQAQRPAGQAHRR